VSIEDETAVLFLSATGTPLTSYFSGVPLLRQVA
jgi:hypothetical protein